mmetsp:Transcript_20028/g.33050  ORF Transcript_20028/g.33050 Transcript_20028/m.33050 type:complete len:126 (-) Transcript_20028:71-448(-)
MFELELRAKNFLTIKDPRMENSGMSGCGSDSSKCHCNIFEGKVLHMKGRGTSSTWTGLEFICHFKATSPISGETTNCNIHVDMPFSSDNKLWYGCDDSEKFKFSEISMPQGKVAKELKGDIYAIG